MRQNFRQPEPITAGAPPTFLAHPLRSLVISAIEIAIESNISKMIITETDCILAMRVRQVRSRHGPRPAISRRSSFEPCPELQKPEDARRPRRVRVSLDDIADKGISCGSWQVIGPASEPD